MIDTLHYIVHGVYPLAFSLLPAPMDSTAARALLIAIGLQESRFTYRRQIGGPARGWWQFERGGGVEGVLEHPASRSAATRVLDVLGYPHDAHVVYSALADNDVLACCFARLLLWTDPRGLPQDAAHGPDGWLMYLATWRPGRPHPETWATHYATAWRAPLPGTVRA